MGRAKERFVYLFMPSKFSADQRLLAFVELVKPELTGLTVMTGMVSFLFAGGRPYDLPGVTMLGVSMFLVGASAAAWNQYMERGHDVLMKRTERRPVPSGRIAAVEAALVGVASGLVGIGGLLLWFGVLPALLAGLTLGIYLGLYTPLKRRTEWNTVVGAIPGALPTLIGWSAATGGITLGGWIFFALLVFWQFPHFFSLAWMYRIDYARAGYQMLPLHDDIQGTRTNRYNLLSVLVLIVLTSCLTFIGFSDRTFLLIGSILGVAFLSVAALVRHQQKIADQASAGRIPRKLFFASLLYLPLLLLSALLTRI